MSVAPGGTQQFTATATYSDGSTGAVTSTATWASSSTSVATVSSAGIVTGVAAGSATITASLTGVTGTTALTVTAAAKTLTSIAVSPSTASITVGATEQFTATGTYSDGSTASVTSTATWTSSSTAAATVNASGLATGVAAGSATITASLSGVSGTAALAVTAAPVTTLTSIAVSPATASIAVGATGQFTATATYSNGTTANVTSTATWTSSETAVATIDATGLATGVASGLCTITATLSGISGTSAVTVTIAAGTGVNIPTWHVDTNRSGLNAAELSLTTSNVSSTTFGKLFSYLVDGYVYGEPLIMSNVAIPNNGTHNVLYVATENDSVYAFDADSYGTGTPLWQTSLLQTGETPLTAGAILPYQGVTSTPVIDPTTNTMYVVSTETSGGVGTFRLNALDITTGAQEPGSPVTITASVAGTSSSGNGSTVTLTTGCVQRAALLLEAGTVYIGFGGCPTGWLLAYNETTLAQTAVFNASPNLNGEGTYASAGGIWMGGGGPVADSAGNIYVVTGNGPWDGLTAWGDTVLKFNAALQIQDYFTPQDYAYMNCADSDLAAGGLLLIPGSTEIIAGGKMGKLYLLNTTSLGQESAGDAGATQTLYFESDVIDSYSKSCTDTIDYTYDTSGLTHTAMVNSYQNYGTAAYFNGSVYLGVAPTVTTTPAGVRQFTYTGGVLAIAGAYPADYTTPSIQEGSYGTTPFISANGTSNGIVWMIDHGAPLQDPDSSTPTDATLRAYDATDLTTQLYNSSTNAADTPGYGIKFTSPVVANGKVYISTGHALTTATTGPMGEIDVYGLQ